VADSTPFDVFLPPEPPTNLLAVAYGNQVSRVHCRERQRQGNRERESRKLTDRQTEILAER